MYAARSGNRQVVRFLLDTDFAGAGKEGLRKADPSVKDNKQQTALDLLKASIANVTLNGEQQKRFDDIVDMLQHAPVPRHPPSSVPNPPASKLPDWKP